MESDELTDHQNQYNNLIPTIPNPFTSFANLISLHAHIISTSTLTLVSPFFYFLSDLFLRRRPPAKEDRPTPTTGGDLLLGRVAAGLAAAAYVAMVLMAAMAAAAILGVALVRAWAEKPVYLKEGLQFDYVEPHPTAVFAFGLGGDHKASVRVGHTLYVSLLLLMPESDYNKDLGVFQLTAELISVEGKLVAKSSHPCMLRFWSWPIRLTRTFLMGVPLILGVTTETQMLAFPIIKHKATRNHPRVEFIKITLIPRAGTMSLPQFYESAIVVQSRPPWTREFVYKWKWTFYVWTTLYVFNFIVMFLVVFLKPFVFPVMASPFPGYERELGHGVALDGLRDDREVSESVKRWRRRRNKRKAALLRGVMMSESESGCESARSDGATSISVTRGEIGSGFEEEGSGDSESVCFRGFE